MATSPEPRAWLREVVQAAAGECPAGHIRGRWVEWLAPAGEPRIGATDEGCCVVTWRPAPVGDYRGECPTCGWTVGQLCAEGGAPMHAECVECEGTGFRAEELLREYPS